MEETIYQKDLYVEDNQISNNLDLMIEIQSFESNLHISDGNDSGIVLDMNGQFVDGFAIEPSVGNYNFGTFV
jgi:hypothetical protein